jgi:predicted glycosyltransferase involved in capsule biosynthesis
LLRRCLADAPIVQSNDRPKSSDSPQLTVLIGHRGLERLSLLQATLKSIAAQKDVDLECIVIEHDVRPQVCHYLPAWVHYVYLAADEDEPYNRSRTFNCGASYARSHVLLLHDNDMLIPSHYASRILNVLKKGFEVVNPKRYVFYLNQSHTQLFIHESVSIDSYPPDYIVQNLEAGGSMAITKDAYYKIGGMDDEFRGWGGEDNEFWDRCLTLPTWKWGYEPIVHLWHSGQPLKISTNNPNIHRYRDLSSQPAKERIERLRSKLSF